MLGSDTDVVEPSSDGITNPGQIGANTGRTARKVSMAQAVHFRLACVLLANIFMTACVASPPIEAEPPDINLPPLIDPDRILPSSAIIAVTSSNEIVLEASQLFDPNPEPLLFYAWIADGGWLSQNARVQLSVDQEDLYRDIYYRFDGVQYAFNPCNPNVRDKRTETIFLYVSDRSFLEVTNTSVTPDEDGYLEVWAWVFQIQPGVCDE